MSTGPESHNELSRYEETIAHLDLVLSEFRERSDEEDCFPNGWIIECSKAYLRFLMDRAPGMNKPLISVSTDGAIGFTWVSGARKLDVLIDDNSVQACITDNDRVQALPPSQVDCFLNDIAA